MRHVKLFCSLFAALVSVNAHAVSYPLPPEGSRLVGSVQHITVPIDNKKPLEEFAASTGRVSAICWRPTRALTSICPAAAPP